MRMGTSATAHRSVTSVIGPIWPTANRPTTEWAAQTSVVKMSRRIAFAQADCRGRSLARSRRSSGYAGPRAFNVGRARLVSERREFQGRPANRLGSDAKATRTPARARPWPHVIVIEATPVLPCQHGRSVSGATSVGMIRPETRRASQGFYPLGRADAASRGTPARFFPPPFPCLRLGAPAGAAIACGPDERRDSWRAA